MEEKNKKIETQKKDIKEPGEQERKNVFNFMMVNAVQAISMMEDKYIDDAIIKLKAFKAEHKGKSKLADSNYYDENQEILKLFLDRLEIFKKMRDNLKSMGKWNKDIEAKVRIMGKNSNKVLEEIAKLVIWALGLS